MTDPTFWIIARAAGLVAEVLLGLGLVAGLTLHARPLGRRLRGADVAQVHRALGLLGLSAIALHGVVLTLDRAVPIPVTALLVPGASPYRPLWVGLGVVAAWMALIVVLTSTVLRRRLQAPAWRAVHMLSYPAFALTVAHGLAAGTDATVGWVLALHVGLIGLVAAATAFRVLAGRPAPARRRPAPAR